MAGSSSSKLQASYFKRVFSLDDDILILNAVADYQALNGPIKVLSSIIPHLPPLFDKLLSVEVDDRRLYDKIRKLRSKFGKQCDKVDRNFATDHDRAVFDLSKAVWGGDYSDAAAEAAAQTNSNMRKRKRKRNSKPAAAAVAAVKKSSGINYNDDQVVDYPYLREEAKRINNLAGVDGLNPQKAKSLDKEMERVRWIELEYQAERMGLLQESFNFISGS